MTADDLPLVEHWLHEPHVGPWWKVSDFDDVTRAIRGDDPVDTWLLVLDGGALVPMVFVVSSESGVVVVDPPEGLFDL